MAFPSDPTSIVVDGKKFKLSELKDEIDSFRSMCLFDLKALDAKAVYAFRDEKSLKLWAKDNSLDQWYKQLRSGVRPPKKSEQEELELLQALKTEVLWQTKRFEKAIAQAGVEITDSDGIVRLIENPDPRRGPILGSAIIFQHDEFRGRNRYLPTNRVYCSLSPFGFDRQISSLFNSRGTTLRLYNLLDGSLMCPDPDDFTSYNRIFRELTISGDRRLSSLTPLGWNDKARSAETR